MKKLKYLTIEDYKVKVENELIGKPTLYGSPGYLNAFEAKEVVIDPDNEDRLEITGEDGTFFTITRDKICELFNKGSVNWVNHHHGGFCRWENQPI